MTRERLRKNLLKIKAETEQFIRDVEWWNTNRPDAPPMDCEPERCLLQQCKDWLRVFKAGDMRECGKISAAMVELAQRAISSE